MARRDVQTLTAIAIVLSVTTLVIARHYFSASMLGQASMTTHSLPTARAGERGRPVGIWRARRPPAGSWPLIC
jgi:hypothetical protein